MTVGARQRCWLALIYGKRQNRRGQFSCRKGVSFSCRLTGAPNIRVLRSLSWGLRPMSSSKLTAADRQRFARARERGHRFAMRATAVVDARYDATRDRLELTQRTGKVRLVPWRLLPELDGVPAAILRSIAVSPAGDAISWRAVEVDVSVRGLLDRERRSRRVDFSTGAGHTT